MFNEKSITKDDYDIMRILIKKYSYEIILFCIAEVKNDITLTKKVQEKVANTITIKTIDYIIEHFNENITLNKLSKIVYVHPKYLSKLFKNQVGLNFTYFVTKIRIHKACLLLREESLSVEKISEMVGYQSEKYFYKIFKSITGCTPKEYKTKHAQMLVL